MHLGMLQKQDRFWTCFKLRFIKRNLFFKYKQKFSIFSALEDLVRGYISCDTRGARFPEPYVVSHCSWLPDLATGQQPGIMSCAASMGWDLSPVPWSVVNPSKSKCDGFELELPSGCSLSDTVHLAREQQLFLCFPGAQWQLVGGPWLCLAMAKEKVVVLVRGTQTFQSRSPTPRGQCPVHTCKATERRKSLSFLTV